MIVPIDTFQGVVRDGQIKDAADRYGYEGYIPYNFVRDLFNIWTYSVYDRSPYDGVTEDTEYETAFIHLLDLINLEYIGQLNGLEFAFSILKQYCTKLNLRAVEAAKLRGKSFELEEEEQYNYSFDLNDISPQVLDLVGLNLDKDVNEIELSEVLKDILKYYNGLKNLPGTLNDSPVLKREQMKYYHQIMKVSKKRLVYPMFKLDYLTKNLPVKIPSITKTDKDTIILLVDISASAFDDPRYLRIYKGVLLYLYDTFIDKVNKLKICYFAYNIVKTVNVSSKKDLAELYHSPINISHGPKGWTESIRYFKKEFSSETIILLTDGDRDSVSLDLNKNNQYHVVALVDNIVLKNLAKNTNGKFICI